MGAARSASGKVKASMKKIIKRFGNIQYRYKVFLAMLLVSVVPLLLCGVMFYGASSKSMRDNLVQTKSAQVRQVSQDLESRLQVYEHIANYLLSLQGFQQVLSLPPDRLFDLYQGYQNIVDPLLETNMYYHPQITRMTIYLKDINLEHGMTIAPFSALEDQEWYQNSFADGIPTESWIISEANREVYYVRPVQQYLQMRAVLVTCFDYDKAMASVGAIPGSEDERVYLLAQDGTVAFSNDEQVLGKTLELDESDGKSAVMRQEMTSIGWTIVSVMSKSIISEALRPTVKATVLLLFFCLAYAVIISVVLANVLVRRTVKLNHLVSQIGDGDAKEELAQLEQYNGAMDEVGVLIDNTGKMIRRLNELKITVYKEKIARRDLEMKALQAQINPHFLYNSLSIINWKAIEAEADEVSSITLKLAEFYRTTLNRGSTMINVEGEMRNIRSYLDIQLIMHDNNFKVEWDVDESVMKWEMPKLVLQPLVENALEHGLDLKEDDDRLLYIHTGQEDGKLVLIVRDNGVGMTQEKADSIIHYDSKGYGVKNVNERISLLYGEKHVFRIVSSEGKGTEIYVRIPGERGKES